MKVKLVVPPVASPRVPTLGVPSLVAYLRSHSIEASACDTNATFFDYLLRRQTMENWYKQALQRLENLESRRQLEGPFQGEYLSVAQAVLKAPFVLEQIDAARNTFCNGEHFFEIDRLLWAENVLKDALEIVSAALYPHCLSFSGYSTRFSDRSSQEIQKYLMDTNYNDLINIFEEVVLPPLLSDDPDIIGISITFPSQWVPGLTLAHLIHDHRPSIHICVGGNMCGIFADILPRLEFLFDFIGSIILFQGERPLLKLCEALLGLSGLDAVPNLIFRDHRGVHVTPIEPGEGIDRLPTPCFDGFDLSQYLTPEPILPIASARGCYWGKCLFCDSRHEHQGRYAPRNVQLVIRDLTNLVERYGVRHFTFVDEAIPPKRLSQISQAIQESGLSIYWRAHLRCEESLSSELFQSMYEAGCRRVHFGVESGNDRVLQAMQKGITGTESQHVLTASKESGLWNHVFLLLGFPGETPKEAWNTVDFLQRNREGIHSFSVNSFLLERRNARSDILHAMGISRVLTNEGEDLATWYDWEGKSKLDSQTVEKILNHLDDYQQTHYSGLASQSHDTGLLYLAHYGACESLHSRRRRHLTTSREEKEFFRYPLQKSPAVTYRLYTFDWSALDQRLADNSIWQVDQTYLGYRHKSERKDFGTPLERDSACVVYHWGRKEFFCFSNVVKKILDICDGTKDFDDLLLLLCSTVDGTSVEEVRAAVKRILTYLAIHNIIVPLKSSGSVSQ